MTDAASPAPVVFQQQALPDVEAWTRYFRTAVIPVRTSTAAGIERLRERKLGVILISHNLNDVFQVADDIAVLYLGAMVATVPRTEVTQGQVVELITTGTYEGRKPTVTNGDIR